MHVNLSAPQPRLLCAHCACARLQWDPEYRIAPGGTLLSDKIGSNCDRGRTWRSSRAAEGGWGEGSCVGGPFATLGSAVMAFAPGPKGRQLRQAKLEHLRRHMTWFSRQLFGTKGNCSNQPPHVPMGRPRPLRFACMPTGVLAYTTPVSDNNIGMSGRGAEQVPGQGRLPALRYHGKNNIMMDAQSRYWLVVTPPPIPFVVAASASNLSRD